MTNPNPRENMQKKYKIICFDLKESRKIKPPRRRYVQRVIIKECNNIRNNYPSLFIWDRTLIFGGKFKKSNKLGYLMEPFIFGDMWVLTITHEANTQFLINYFESCLCPELPFYWEVGYYDVLNYDYCV